jgi:hypothetical protein
VLAFALGCGLVSTSSVARADDDLPSGIVRIDETGDRWLHEHCSYRGVASFQTSILDVTGTVASFSSTKEVPFGKKTTWVKKFRCVEAPPFALPGWKPAPPEADTCTDKTDDRICVKPLRASVTVAPPVAVVKRETPKAEPPSMPEPAPPKKNSVRAPRPKAKRTSRLGAG